MIEPRRMEVHEVAGRSVLRPYARGSYYPAEDTQALPYNHLVVLRKGEASLAPTNRYLFT